jgi:hypothetical protein
MVGKLLFTAPLAACESLNLTLALAFWFALRRNSRPADIESRPLPFWPNPQGLLKFGKQLEFAIGSTEIAARS